ncbi:Chorion transcription factor Cf2 [Orchesella cincta]|uniref:Chorion transcription factor Cf2 n=1 Tax=Orchesella cincta TaxID=48709 RepID=A0A1D2MFY8_ORCCI|nr:Chorion transcription factor Cf2 [Orchesella cincta]
MSTLSETVQTSSKVNESSFGKNVNAIDKPSRKKEKRYYCQQCDTWLVNKSSLDYHSKKHSGQRDFKCELCGKAYIASFQLNRHITNKHEGEKTNLSTPTRKIKKDQNPRPYACQVCTKRYVQKSCLYRHFKRAHGGEAAPRSKPPSPPPVLDEEAVDGFENEMPAQVDEQVKEQLEEPIPRLGLVGEPRSPDDNEVQELINPSSEILMTPQSRSPSPQTPQKLGLG